MKHAVKAAVRGDEDEAIRALIINPLVSDYNKARDCFQELKWRTGVIAAVF